MTVAYNNDFSQGLIPAHNFFPTQNACAPEFIPMQSGVEATSQHELIL